MPEARRAEVKQLIALVNEQLWIGHFDIWNHEGVILFRNSHLLTGGADVTPQQCEALLRSATDSCDLYYQAFQFVVWAGKSAAEALESVLFETVGEAESSAAPARARELAEQSFDDIGPVVLVGAGKMGLALARGWIAGGLPPDRLVLVDPFAGEAAKSVRRRSTGCACCKSAERRADACAGAGGEAADHGRGDGAGAAVGRQADAGDLDRGGHFAARR